ncbi:DUF1566 domain-containing protein [Pseudomonas anguilliseptica]|uniref:Lcl C-terminal domain-containing protein n=1 Tax=Pseudomonas anguilliseptica TaxID=53406 RepID=UPI000B8A3D6E|nr:DUF1566 domain-containing protein [Pseudomonas anguilliseptica]
MSKRIFCAVTFLLAAGLQVCTAAVAGDQLVGSGGAPARFVLKGGEVLDLQTHLRWQRCSFGMEWDGLGGCSGKQKLVTLKEAQRSAVALGDGWRLPSAVELHSLVDVSHSDVVIDTVVFPGGVDQGEGAKYWSSSQVEDIPSLFYYIDFLSGAVDGHSQGFSLAVRFVRSGD